MKHKLYKVSLLFFFAGSVFAQKTSKKFSEQFYTSKDVEIEINASNTDIEVINWNKNEVSVEAEIIIEGASKKEAEEYLKNNVFEALGNKSKVKINANNGRRSHYNFNNNFVYYNADSIRVGRNNIKLNGNVVVGKPISGYTIYADSISSGYRFPKVIDIPEVDYETLYIDFDEFDFDKYEKEGGNYFFQWQDGANNITIKSKKEWEEFKKTKEYKKYKESVKKRREEFKKRRKMLEKRREEMNKAQKERFEAQRESYERARLMHKKNEERLRKHMAKVVNGRPKYKYVYSVRNNNYLENNKKVKITRKLIIKAPKKATFNLNTRHCKVKLPSAKVSGRVSYGTFKADALTGGSLKVYSSPVNINTLNACTLFLNNVQSADIESISNLKLKSNSSTVKINKANNNVEVSDEFGNLSINNINANFDKFLVELKSSVANLNFLNLKSALTASSNKSGYSHFPSRKPTMVFRDNEISSSGNFTISSDDNKVKINGRYSKIKVKK